MDGWPFSLIYFGLILLNTLVPLLLYRLAVLIICKFGGPQAGIWRVMLLSFIGWAAFWIVGIVIVEIVIMMGYPTNFDQNPFIFLLFLAAYSLVVIFPLKLISRFSYIKSSMLIAIFWVLQFLILLALRLTLFKPTF